MWGKEPDKKPLWFRKDGLFCIGRVAWDSSLHGVHPSLQVDHGIVWPHFSWPQFFLAHPPWLGLWKPSQKGNKSFTRFMWAWCEGHFSGNVGFNRIIYIYSHESEGVTSLNKCCIQCTSAEFYCILQSFFVRSNTWGVPFILTGSIAIVLGPLYPNIW